MKKLWKRSGKNWENNRNKAEWLHWQVHNIITLLYFPNFPFLQKRKSRFSILSIAVSGEREVSRQPHKSEKEKSRVILKELYFKKLFSNYIKQKQKKLINDIYFSMKSLPGASLLLAVRPGQIRVMIICEILWLN